MNQNPKTNILLAVDFAPAEPVSHCSAAIDMARELVRDSADQVIVLHVREFSVARLALMMTEHGGADGQHQVDEIVAGLRAAGVRACGLVREADAGHVARTVLDAADEFGARVIVLSSARRRVPLGSVVQHLLRHADLPVVIARTRAAQASELAQTTS
jgi:nucleotide-binding universal stress UspA family protein